MRIRKCSIFTQKVKNLLMQHYLPRTVHLATKGSLYYYFTRNQKKTFCITIVRNVVLLILSVIITEI